MSPFNAFFVNPLKWLRVTVAAVFFIGIAYAFLHGIPAWNVPNMTGGGQGMEDSFALAQWQFVPSVLGALGWAGISVIVLAVLLALTLLFGRVYCSFICPLGILQDIVFRVRRWLLPKRLLKFARPVPLVRYAVLAALAACCVTGLAGLALNWLDPYSIFGRIMYTLAWPAAIWGNNLLAGDGSSADLGRMVYYPVALPALLASAGMLGLVVVMSAWRGRLYCNTVCPVGSLLGLLSRFSLFRLGFDPSACKKCGKCIKACKAQCLNLREYSIDASRCVACYDCVSACDEGGIHYRWFTKTRRLRQTSANGKKPAKKLDPPVSAPSCSSPAAAAQTPSFLAGSSRRDFLGATVVGLAGAALSGCRGEAAQKLDPTQCILPPGAGSPERFLDACTGCQMCIANCPTHVLQPAYFELGVKGFMKPRMDFSTKYCLYDCHRCADVCPAGAIRKLPVTATRETTELTKDTTRIAVAQFYVCRCLVRRKDMDCGACTEHCPTKALYTVPYIGADGQEHRLPRLDPTLCIGCGACEHACPVTTEKPEERERFGPCNLCEVRCEFKKRREIPTRALIIRAVNPQQQAVKKFEEKAVDPVGDTDFPF